MIFVPLLYLSVGEKVGSKDDHLKTDHLAEQFTMRQQM